jgi:methylmalonyl-CoA mutase N-terminal domain/subunit
MFKQLLIIKNETKIDKVDNICEGSYYISFLTENLLKESFNLFKKIEKEGGVFKNLSFGIIEKEIEKNNKKEIELYKCKDKILVGYNAYNDKMPEENTINKKPILFKNNLRIETY